MIANKLRFQKIPKLITQQRFMTSGFSNPILKRTYLQIKDMAFEQRRAEIQQEFDKGNHIEEYNKVYKPTYTIEFNRVGEVLLYSCDPFKHKEIYFKYPYVFWESLSPLCLFLFFANPLQVAWGTSYLFLFAAQMLWFPRCWYLHSMQYRIRRMWLLRGGRVIKFERSTIAGDQLTNWVEVRHFQPLTQDFLEFDTDEADFLDESGQLKYELGTELEHFKQFSVNDQDVNVFFMKQGIVHHPELFEAVVKGYHVDTRDFVINTLLDERVMEPHHNY